MKTRCSACDAHFYLKAGMKACPSCGTGLHELMVGTPSDNAPKRIESKKARKRRAAALADRSGRNNASTPSTRSKSVSSRRPAPVLPPPHVLGEIFLRDGEVWLRYDGDSVRRARVATSSLPVDKIVGYVLPFRISDLHADQIRATVLPCRTLHELAESHRTGRPVPESASRHHVGPRPPGDTPLERQADPLAQLERIQKLERRNDRAAWAELANAWRVPSLRGPIERVMAHLGWMRFQLMLTSVPGWPEGLAELVDSKLSEERPRPFKMKQSAIYSHDEYWLADW